VKRFHGLIGDQRTRKTFAEIVKGIIAAGRLICQQIAARSAELSKGKKGSQRLIRLAIGQRTQRLREVAIEQWQQAAEEELWLIAESSDLRKPEALARPYLMQVRDLDEQLVPGYRTLNYHTERKVAWQDRQGQWYEATLHKPAGTYVGYRRSKRRCRSRAPSG
jgi:hypothetical protein